MTEEVRLKDLDQWVEIRHRVALAGQVIENPSKRPLAGVLVEIIQAPDAFTQWLALRALQFSGRWPVLYEHPDRPLIARDGLFYILDYGQNNNNGRYTYCTRTARDGFFYFLNLPDGDYTLKGSLPGAGSRYGTREAKVTVPQNGDSVQPPLMVTIELPATTIEGGIKNQNGEAVAGAWVRLAGSGEQTYSDAHGCFQLVGVEVGTKEYTNLGTKECPRILQISEHKYNSQDVPVKIILAGDCYEQNIVLIPE